jgi:hypothetical protein
MGLEATQDIVEISTGMYASLIFFQRMLNSYLNRSTTSTIWHPKCSQKWLPQIPKESRLFQTRPVDDGPQSLVLF